MIPFDVNNDGLRKVFFDQILIDRIVGLTEETKSLWGKMSPQNMIEHLTWAFEISTGKINVSCQTPVNVLERVKKFLYENRPMPQNYKNPLLDENPLPFRFEKLSDAKKVFHQEINYFVRYFDERPEAIHTHPVFGPLGAGEWQRIHFKHCYHHLLQFGLINPIGTVST
jgi:oxepin-CoA hydrolase / 3-oxo-5,6-dehydrosuberyl-CoA semialdehyde dehydrogenase